MSTLDEVASTADGLGSVGPDGTRGAEPLAESSPAPAAAANVEVVPAPNREDILERLKKARLETKHTKPS